MVAKHPLKALNVAKIDIEAARRHFDLPIEDQFHTKSDLREGLKSTKAQLLDLLGEAFPVTIFRGMTVSSDFVDTLGVNTAVGQSWAWADDGALKGSGLASRNPAEGEIGIVLVASALPEDINWAFTVAVNTFHEDEKEIVLDEGAKLSLQKILLVEDGRLIRDILTTEKRQMVVTSS